MTYRLSLYSKERKERSPDKLSCSLNSTVFGLCTRMEGFGRQRRKIMVRIKR